MEQETETYGVDTIKHRNNEFDTTLIRNGEQVLARSVYANSLDLNGPIKVELGEYFTYIRGDMKVTVSYIQMEDEEFGEYRDDYRIDSVEVFE